MTDVLDKFGDWIKEGFTIYKDNLGVLILSSLLAVVLMVVTLGILIGPMLSGLIIIVLQLRDGKRPPPVAGDVFKGFQYFLPSFLFFIVWGVLLVVACVILALVPCIGHFLSVCLCLAASAFLMFGLFLIVDQKMDFWSASMASIEKVKPAFLPFLGLSLVAEILGQIGAVACGIGVIVTMPINYTILAAAYRDVFGGGTPSQTQAFVESPEPPKSSEDTGDGMQ